MDMLLIGNGCVTHAEEMTQMAIWSISASPLIMGNDMRNVSAASKAIIKNADAIKVSQDPLGQMGIRITADLPQQVWARELANGDVAVALYNKADGLAPKQPPIPHGVCPKWTATKDGYCEQPSNPPTVACDSMIMSETIAFGWHQTRRSAVPQGTSALSRH